MECIEVQNRLLDAENPRAEAEADAVLAAHLRDCPTCRRLVDRLMDLEETWRSMPLSAEAETARQQFLKRVADGIMPARAAASERSLSRRRWLTLSTAAASCAALGGTVCWLLLAQDEAQASDELVDELLEWNLGMAEASGTDQRERLYKQHAGRLRQAVKKAKLKADRALLADCLLDNAEWLVANEDPVYAAEHFEGLAERLLELANEANESGNHRRTNRLLQQYGRVIESGVNPNIERADASDTLDFDHQRQLEKVTLQDATHVRRLSDLLECAPEASRREIQQVMGLHRKRAKKPNRHKPHAASSDNGD